VYDRIEFNLGDSFEMLAEESDSWLKLESRAGFPVARHNDDVWAGG
jgi:hypothetical protein